MDYQKMWETLRQSIISRAKCYNEGIMMSLSESVHGETQCKEILELMDQIEESESTKI